MYAVSLIFCSFIIIFLCVSLLVFILLLLGRHACLHAASISESYIYIQFTVYSFTCEREEVEIVAPLTVQLKCLLLLLLAGCCCLLIVDRLFLRFLPAPAMAAVTGITIGVKI